MASYLFLADLEEFAALQIGFLIAKHGSGEELELAQMVQGDEVIVVADPRHHSSEEESVLARQCASVGLDWATVSGTFASLLVDGQGSACLQATVAGPSDLTAERLTVPVASVPIDPVIRERDLLRLRRIPYPDVQQLLNRVPGRRILPVIGLPQALKEWQIGPPDALLRRLTLVHARSRDEAITALPERYPGDRTLVAEPSGIVGLFKVGTDEALIEVGGPINISLDLIERTLVSAAEHAGLQDPFDAFSALDAIAELRTLTLGSSALQDVEDPGIFYRRFDRLHANLREAESIERRPRSRLMRLFKSGEPSRPSLEGITADGIRAQLPGGFAIGDETIREIAAALLAGKHILLSGPPGTGKSTLAEAASRAIVGEQFDVSTATADWTTFDTIGGYLPRIEGSGLYFEPGIVLRSLASRRWLIIDEINRADIDKAFGPLFSVLSGSDVHGNSSVILPYQEEGERVRVERVGVGEATARYVVTPDWRLFGTLNVSDKASLFQLSFAFLRRFAVIDVPLPSDASYVAWARSLLKPIGNEAVVANLADGLLAAATGPRQLGPAILRDIIKFAKHHYDLTEGNAADPVASVVISLRLFAVPQYEGASRSETETFVAGVNSKIALSEALKSELELALRRVSLG